MICKRCNIDDTITHRIVTCPKAIFVWQKMSTLFNLPFVTNPTNIKNLLLSPHQSSMAPTSLIYAFIHVTLWVIHTSTLEERNHSLVVSNAELTNRVTSTACSLFFSYHLKVGWTKKAISLFSGWSDTLYTINPATSRVCLNFPP